MNVLGMLTAQLSKAETQSERRGLLEAMKELRDKDRVPVKGVALVRMLPYGTQGDYLAVMHNGEILAVLDQEILDNTAVAYGNNKDDPITSLFLAGAIPSKVLSDHLKTQLQTLSDKVNAASVLRTEVEKFLAALEDEYYRTIPLTSSCSTGLARNRVMNVLEGKDPDAPRYVVPVEQWTTLYHSYMEVIDFCNAYENLHEGFGYSCQNDKASIMRLVTSPDDIAEDATHVLWMYKDRNEEEKDDG